MSKDIQGIIAYLNSIANPSLVEKRAAKFGINNTNGLGITHKDLNLVAKEIGKNKSIAKGLFDTNIYEAQLICSKIYPPKEVTFSEVYHWTPHFINWEICDSFCILFAQSPIVLEIITEYLGKKDEFDKRVAFATIACYCNKNKYGDNKVFTGFFPVIESAMNDERLYVKKAVSWAMRSIGKRNLDLKASILELCYTLISKNPSKTVKWIIKDVLKKLEGENLRVSDYPRNIYRKQ